MPSVTVLWDMRRNITIFDYSLVEADPNIQRTTFIITDVYAARNYTLPASWEGYDLIPWQEFADIHNLTAEGVHERLR